MNYPRAFSFLALLFLLPGFISCSSEKHASGGLTADEKALRKKYAGMMGVTENEITNLTLYKFIDDWYSVPYKAAGKTKAGVDCSGFVSVLCSQVYKKTVAGSAATIYKGCEPTAEKNLKEGDLVFFKINSDKITHVGVYLKNHYFVHASTHKGVIVSSLEEEYYRKYFYKGGKIK